MDAPKYFLIPLIKQCPETLGEQPEHILTYLKKKCPETLFGVDNESIQILFEQFFIRSFNRLRYCNEQAVIHEIVADFLLNEYAQTAFKHVIGKNFEKNNIPHSKDVFIDEFGVVRYQKQLNCNKIDFIIGVPPKEGSSITEHCVINCRHNCHKLLLNDTWSIKEISRPKLFILITSSKEYPDAHSFSSSLERMIFVTKEKEPRRFVSNIDFLMGSLKKFFK
jgi:hypothetical protein